MSQNTDQPIIKLILAGDTKSYAKLITKYQHMVYNLALRLVGNKEDAEEVAQDTFLRAFNALADFKGESKFSTWLYRIAYHKGLDVIKKKRELKVSSIDSYPNLDVIYLESSWDSLEGKEQKRTIKEAMEDLDGDDAFLLTLFYFKELSLSEIAEIKSLQANTVKVKLFRARKRLASILKKKMEPEIIEGYERK
ncbi:RNA polymerase sigma factor [Maribacter aestuarii]|uniref:RNA polymerase sigma factor n=1 Tax=Maribacter aestuarii TaxID=1130723 RepID=UPI00248D077C|nr:sigma-70 family RNA polymerase sigma factor [Maribacter aestuarii]